MGTDERTSAVLPVHAAVPAGHVRGALGSLQAQTRPVDEIVVVEDGPLGPDVRVLLDGIPALVRVRLGINQGAGVANQAGLRAARHPWIVKVDADDLSEPHRVERLLGAARERSLDVVGASLAEFVDDPAMPGRVRRMPVEHDEIRRRMVWNNPINHPTVVFRREVALAAGGYPALRSMEDYALFISMMSAGARFGNVDEVLVRFRADPDMRGRRSGIRRHGRNELEIARLLRSSPMGRPVLGRVVLAARLAARIAPTGVVTTMSNVLLTTRHRGTS